MEKEMSLDKMTRKLNLYKIGKLVCHKYKSIQIIKSKTKSKAEIIFKNMNEANRLLEDDELTEAGLQAFIPSFKLVRKGVIRSIDEDVSENEIRENIEFNIEVVSIKRLSRRNRELNKKEGDLRWISAKSAVITFAGQHLPYEIFIHKIHHEVEPSQIQIYTGNSVANI